MPPSLSRSAARLALACIGIGVCGCGGGQPPSTTPDLPPPVVYEPPPPPLLEEIDLEGEVRNLVDDEELAAAEALLRHALEVGTDDASPARVKLLLGEILEREGRPDEAVVLYCSISGTDGGTDELAAAWDGVTRVRLMEGDAAGATHAALRAWSVAGEREKEDRADGLTRMVRLLSDRDLQVLSRLAVGEPSRRFLLQELAARGEKLEIEDDFRVTLIAPFTGRFSNFGRAFRLGAEIALEERNAPFDTTDASPIPAVRLLTRDTQGDLLAATQETRAAILEDGSRAILGPLLSVTSVGAGAVAEGFGVPLIAPTATDHELERVGRHVLTLQPSPKELTEPLAKFSVSVLGNVRHGVLLARDGVSEEYEREFRAAVEAYGGEVVVSVTFDPGERDFRRLIERFDAAEVDAVYVPGRAADLEALAPQLEFYEFGRRILGNGGWTSPRVMDSGNLALEGSIFAVQSADHPGSEFRLRLRDAVWRRSGVETSPFHIQGYLSMSALLSALDQGARESEELVEMLRRRDSWPERPEAERIQILTFRDGVLGPASWAVGFDLTSRFRVPEEPEDEEDEAEPFDGSIE